MSLVFGYPSVYPENDVNYLSRGVKIEMGARSEVSPSSLRDIMPYVGEALPDYLDEPRVSVRTIAAERTCLDKLLIVHEENHRSLEKTKKERMSRHYYDLFRLIRSGVSRRALSDRELLARVIEHRSVFFAYSWMDYTNFDVSDLELVPRKETLPFWRTDYEKMRREMFFGHPPTFDEILEEVAVFQESLRMS